MDYTRASGRRKTSVARVYLKPGKGVITINSKDYKEYFNFPTLQALIVQPFEVTNTENEYDVKVNVRGGGATGQAEAIRHAISKALIEVSEELRPALKEKGFLTRDSRMVERKKPGRAKARKRFQYRKR